MPTFNPKSVGGDNFIVIGFFTILNVRIDGIREEDNETWLNTETKAKEVLQEKLNLSFEPVIERAHRTGTRSRPGAADGINTPAQEP